MILKRQILYSIWIGLGLIAKPQFAFSQMSETTTSEAEELIILAPAKINEAQKFLDEKKNKISTADGSSVVQISRQGDSNAASALKRITGVTIIDDKYAVIRGLGERYSSTRLNGFFLPAMEPNKRQFALNAFPTSALSAIEVEKSYLASWPSSFSGGMVNLKSNPELASARTRIQFGLGYQSGASEFLKSSSSNGEFLSSDLSSRELPKSISRVLSAGRPLIVASPSVPAGFTTEELKAFSSEMPKNYNLSSDEQSYVIPRLQFQSGKKWDTDYFRLHSLTSIAYAQGAEQESFERSNFDISSGQTLVLSDRNTVDHFELEKSTSLQLSNLFKFTDRHELLVNLYGLRKASESTQVQQKSGPGVNDFLRKQTSIEFSQRTLLGLQLEDSFEFLPNHAVVVGLARNQVANKIPDSRQYTYRQRAASDSIEFDSEVSGNSRSWSELKEDAQELKLEYRFGEKSQPQFVIGANELSRDRLTSTSRFQFIKNYSSGETPDLSMPLDQILSNQDDWILINQTQAADAYEASSQQRALYYTYNQKVTSDFRLVFGHRLETNEVSVDNVDSFTRSVYSGTRANYESLLSSISIINTRFANQKTILAFGETLVIPDFRELSSIRYYDDEEGLEAKGNIGLRPTEIQSVDLRHEFYPQSEEVFSVGIFAKEFTNPIEDTFLPIAGGVVRYPQNISSASLSGLEGEMRLSARKWMRELRFIHLNLNGSLIQSEVDITPGEEGSLTNTKRPMQGQSDWILNGEVYFQRDPKGILLSLTYNVAGPRIYAVGTEGRPDTLESEFHQLDFAGSYGFGESGKLNFRVRNILDSERQLFMGPEQSFALKTGPEFVVSYTETL